MPMSMNVPQDAGKLEHAKAPKAAARHTASSMPSGGKRGKDRHSVGSKQLGYWGRHVDQRRTCSFRPQACSAGGWRTCERTIAKEKCVVFGSVTIELLAYDRGSRHGPSYTCAASRIVKGRTRTETTLMIGVLIFRPGRQQLTRDGNR